MFLEDYEDIPEPEIWFHDIFRKDGSAFNEDDVAASTTAVGRKLVLYARNIIESCYDGDTCTTSEGEKIRLACIDTAEIRGPKAQPVKAQAAKDYLNNLIAGKEVFIKRITKDRYGRTVAELSINGKNIQQIMFNSGFAKIYSKYAYQCAWSR